MYQDIQPDIQSYDYQVTTPEYIPPYDNFYLSKKEDSNILRILRNSAQKNYPYLGWAVDLEQSNRQPGCASTCNTILPRDIYNYPNAVYDYNSCMNSCETSGTSAGIIASKKPGNSRW